MKGYEGMKGKLKTIGAVMASLISILLMGCDSDSTERNISEQTAEQEQFVPEITLTYEAEEGTFAGNVSKSNNLSNL